MIIPDDHVLVRALHLPFWNGTFATKSAFEKQDVSVSSLGILDEATLISIFRHDLEQVAKKPVKVEAIAKISAGAVRGACKTLAEELKASVDVFHAPVENNPPWADNPAHCEIRASIVATNAPRALSAGMAKSLVNSCTFVKLP